LCVLLMMMLLRGWEFDELEGKSTATKKPNSYLVSYIIKLIIALDEQEHLAETQAS